jgi:hypothetical protein
MLVEPNRAPIVIKIMLACWTSPFPSDEVGESVWHSRAGQQTRAYLTREGLICSDNRATPRGEAWISAFCNIPLPVLASGLEYTGPADGAVSPGGQSDESCALMDPKTAR